MNKKLQFKSLLLLAAMLLSGANYVWGQEEPKVTLDFSTAWTAGADEGGEKVFTTTVGDNTYKIKGTGADNFKFNKVSSNSDNYYFFFGKKDAYIKLPAFSFKVSKIVITGNSGGSASTKQNIFVGDAAVSTETTGVKETNTYEIASGYQEAGTVYTIKVTSAHNSQITKIEIYEKTANTVASPTFTPAEGTYTSKQDVTLSCETNEAKIYYTTDGTTPSSSSTLYSEPIPVTATTTFNAIAIKGSYSSSVVTATYTILSPKTIADVRSQGTGDVLTQGIVTSCAGTTGYIQDENAAICVYGQTLNVGDKVMVSGKLSTYKGLLEITNPVVTVISSGNAVTPVVKTIEEINTDYSGDNALQGMLVKIEDATVTAKDASNTTIKQGESTILVRSIPSDVEYAVNDKLTLVGNIGCFDAAQIANPTNVVVKKNVKPAINANDVTIEFDATSGEIAYTVDNPTGATLTAAVTAGASWISNIVVAADKVTFTAEANEGEAREATITLSYTEAEDKVVTVTQKELGYATLPFAFDGGKADIAKTFGLSQVGLGSDYGSNAPKLKFDSSGDCLILRINESAKLLSFDIKGNGFSSGSTSTFKVQTSATGVDDSYSDLKTYTELGDKENVILELASNVRYIKWIYTEKGSNSGGNVGLGNIKVFNGEVITIPESKYTTFASTNNIDFEGTGVTVCIAKVENGAAQLAAIRGNIAPANTGVILYAEKAGNYAGTIIEATDISISDNDLVGVTTETAVPWTADSKYNYILQGGVFKKATGAKLHAGKAYLSTNYQAASRELNIVFDGEATAIKAVETAADKNVYDLQGRKVAAPTKGLYIINGKKMIVK